MTPTRPPACGSSSPSQLIPALRRLVSDESELPQRAALVASQMLGLSLARSVLELPPFDAMPPNVIAANVGPTIQRYLHEPLRPAGSAE